MLCIIQARMSSSRLPGKSCRDILGTPLILRVHERVKQAKRITKIVVGTSIETEDDEIAKLCNANNIIVYRGPLVDVALRFKEVLINHPSEAFVRICADSPLIDPEIIDSVITLFKSAPCDIATNTFPRSFPKGQSVEVIDTKCFIDNYAYFSTTEKEHITSYFYGKAEQFSIKNLTSTANYSAINHSIDTLEDLNKITHLLEKTKQQSLKWIDYIYADTQ